MTRAIVLCVLAGIVLAACSEAPARVQTGSPSATATSSSPRATTPSVATPAVATPSRPKPIRPEELRLVASELEVPWDFAVLPDRSVLVTQRGRGDVVRVTTGKASSVVGRIPEVHAEAEGGLLGIALSPRFSSDRHLFLYYTTVSDNRVVRYSYDNGLRDPQPIVTGIPKARGHNGGRLRFGPDGNLYIGTGDAGERGAAQDVNSLAGKILRVKPDGSLPDDNPFGNAVFSYGHRNVQGFGWDAEGRFFASEFGQNQYDELNIIQAGHNYGWPATEGPTRGEAGITAPELVWSPAEASPSGVAVAANGVVFLAALRGERVWRTAWTGSGMSEPMVYLDGIGRIREVQEVGDELWVLTNNTARGTKRSGDDRLVAVPLR